MTLSFGHSENTAPRVFASRTFRFKNCSDEMPIWGELDAKWRAHASLEARYCAWRIFRARPV